MKIIIFISILLILLIQLSNAQYGPGMGLELRGNRDGGYGNNRDYNDNMRQGDRGRYDRPRYGSFSVGYY